MMRDKKSHESIVSKNLSKIHTTLDMTIQPTRHADEAWLLSNHKEMPNGSQNTWDQRIASVTKEKPSGSQVIGQGKKTRKITKVQ